MVSRNADDVEFDHGALDFSDVEFYTHGVYTEIFDADGLGRWPAPSPRRHGGAASSAGPIRTVQGSDGTYYVYDLALDMNGGALWVRGTISDARGSVMEVIVPLAWSVLLVLVLLSVAGGSLISSRSFKPMEKVIAAAESISGGEDLSRRIGLPRGRSEINRLAGAFDDMFDRLERSFHAEAQFTSDASHELRTPVAVILTECDTLDAGRPHGGGLPRRGGGHPRAGPPDVPAHHPAAAHHPAGAGHPEAGNGERRPQRAGPLRLHGPGPAGPHQGITLTCDTPDPVTLPLDVTLMTRLLNNLISNAFRYGRDGGHTAVSVVREGDTAVLSVADDGIGIPPALQERIWQRFYQVDPPLRQRGHRPGPVHGAADRPAPRRHREVSSIPGQGSTFTVRSPWLKAQNDDTPFCQSFLSA